MMTTDHVITQLEIESERQRQAKLLSALLVGIAGLHGLALLYGTLDMIGKGAVSIYSAVQDALILGLTLLYAGLFYLNRRGLTRLAAYLTCGIFTLEFFVFFVANLLEGEPAAPAATVMAMIMTSAILIAGMVISRQAIIWFAALNMALISTGFLLVAGTENVALLISIVLLILFIAVISWLYQKTIQESHHALLRTRLEKETELERLVAARTQRLEAAQQELIRQEHLATVGKVAATVSHELRNPLATICNSASVIDLRIRDKEPNIERALDRIQRNVTRCDNIIAELLDYARTPDLNPEPVRFDDWLNQVLDERPLPEHVTLLRDTASGVEISLDPERFKRAMTNLIENACQAMPESPEASDKARVLSVQSQVVADRLKIVISDTGTGIPPDAMPHIFEPLYSTKGFGVGLGLSVVKEVVKQHGGEIEITSEAGEGTQAVVWLPLENNEE